MAEEPSEGDIVKHHSGRARNRYLVVQRDGIPTEAVGSGGVIHEITQSTWMDEFTPVDQTPLFPSIGEQKIMELGERLVDRVGVGRECPECTAPVWDFETFGTACADMSSGTVTTLCTSMVILELVQDGGISLKSLLSFAADVTSLAHLVASIHERGIDNLIAKSWCNLEFWNGEVIHDECGYSFTSEQVIK